MCIYIRVWVGNQVCGLEDEYNYLSVSWRGRTDAIGPLTFFGSYCGMALHGDHPTHTRKHMKEMQRGFPDGSMEGRAMEA